MKTLDLDRIEAAARAADTYDVLMDPAVVIELVKRARKLEHTRELLRDREEELRGGMSWKEATTGEP